MTQDETRAIWTLLASLGGSVTALSFRPYKTMSRVEVLLSLFVGASFSTFVGPLVVAWILGSGPHDPKIEGALYYGMASGSNILIPLFIRWLSKSFGASPHEGEKG